MEERKHIRLLPAAVANKIAAGEVVERPASVVKEFMENSFDAGATRIEVTIVSGGRKLISVSDDGCGMERDDALNSLEPHATSKIRIAEDIEHIDTYGFRGEAIPSVAAVSRMIIKTCARGDNSGTCIEIDGGKIRSVSEIGFPVGSTFEVRDLFFNIPVRRKFLKAYGTEQAHIRNVFMLQALSHPEVSLKLKADGRDLISVVGGATLEERVHDLFGAELLDSMRLVDFSSGNISVKGYVGLPSISRADRSEQYIFVNRRAAIAPIIAYALREAYPPLDGDRKPVAILFIDLPPEEVDVNVHPQKREVRFRDSRSVRDALILAIQKALGISPTSDAATTSSNPSPNPTLAQPAPNDLSSPRNDDVSAASPHVFSSSRYSPPAFPDIAPNSATASGPHPIQQPFSDISGNTLQQPGTDSALDSRSKPVQELLPITSIGEAPGLWKWCRILGRIAKGYVLLESDGGFVVLNPRAAHERILYEKMLGGSLISPSPAQALLAPVTVTLPPVDAERIRSNFDDVRAIGIAIDSFGDNAFIIEALPPGVSPSQTRSFIIDIAQSLAEGGIRHSTPEWRRQALARAAAASAVSNIDNIPWKALAALVEDLAKTEMPYTSPRGNPTMLFTSLNELDRKFGYAK